MTTETEIEKALRSRIRQIKEIVCEPRNFVSPTETILKLCDIEKGVPVLVLVRRADDQAREKYTRPELRELAHDEGIAELRRRLDELARRLDERARLDELAKAHGDLLLATTEARRRAIDRAIEIVQSISWDHPGAFGQLIYALKKERP